jgi:hypothetical protein
VPGVDFRVNPAFEGSVGFGCLLVAPTFKVLVERGRISAGARSQAGYGIGELFMVSLEPIYREGGLKFLPVLIGLG